MSPFLRTPKASGVDGAHPAVVPEVAGGPPGRVELDDLPPQEAGLRGERGQEAVDGGGVLDVPEQLAGPPAGDVAPLQRTFGVFGGDAPPAPRHGDGGAVPAGQQGQPPVGEGQASACVAGAGRQAESFEGDDDPGGPLGRAVQQPGQLLEGDPGPVGDQVEGALLCGLEQDWQHVVGDVPPGTLDGEVGGRVGPSGFRLLGKPAAGGRPFEGAAQVDGCADPGRTPYPIARSGQDRLALQGEQGRYAGGDQRQLLLPVLLPHRRMLSNSSRLLIDVHRPDINRSLLTIGPTAFG